MKPIYPAILLLLFLTLGACTSKKREAAAPVTPQYAVSPTLSDTSATVDEASAIAILDTARIAFRAGGYDTALRLAKSIRHRYPRALNTREAALLLIDSIELYKASNIVARLDATGQAATDELTATERAKAVDRVAFFQDKLKQDLAHTRMH